MPVYRYKSFFPLLIATLLICVGLFYLVFRSACSGISCVHFPKKAMWNIHEVYENGKKSWRGMLENADKRIRLEIVRDVTKTEADEFTKIRLMMIKGLYDTERSPYPGAISATIRCDDIYKPHPEILQTGNGLPITYFTAGLNSRFQYGVCIDSQIVYRSYSGFYYCDDTRVWVHAEMIVPDTKGNTEEAGRAFFRTVTCQ